MHYVDWARPLSLLIDGCALAPAQRLRTPFSTFLGVSGKMALSVMPNKFLCQTMNYEYVLSSSRWFMLLSSCRPDAPLPRRLTHAACVCGRPEVRSGPTSVHIAT